MLDCGRGDMVVARDETSAVVLSSKIADSSTPEMEGPPRLDGSSTAIELGKSLRSSISASWARFGSSTPRLSHSGLGELCMSSGQVEKPGGKGSGGWSDEGVGILKSGNQCHWVNAIPQVRASPTRIGGGGAKDSGSRSVTLSQRRPLNRTLLMEWVRADRAHEAQRRDHRTWTKSVNGGRELSTRP